MDNTVIIIIIVIVMSVSSSIILCVVFGGLGTAGLIFFKKDSPREFDFSNLKDKSQNRCLDGNGSSLHYGNCQKANDYQNFSLKDKFLKHKASGKCIDSNLNFVDCVFSSWTFDGSNLRNNDTDLCLNGDGKKFFTGSCDRTTWVVGG
ncbi:hypothetical protein EB118_08815 [bacterium]|nr:hypothetical protein [bacterium]NDC94659.1 hypothetical protein [bacterium]NDD84301.1 hypothetical protein [bacterium]NDG30163.1 hypothetical protein [bacterium]